MMNANLHLLSAQHKRLLAAADALERIAAGPAPTRFDDLAAMRWAFTRDMLLHFAHVQTQILNPLMRDRRPDVGTIAARSSDDLLSVYEQFQRHASRWKGLPPEENWGIYAQAIALLMRRLRVRLAAQESQLYLLLPAQPGGVATAPTRPPLDYGAEACRIRRMIYDHAGRNGLVADAPLIDRQRSA